jgi:hypothetical protein
MEGMDFLGKLKSKNGAPAIRKFELLVSVAGWMLRVKRKEGGSRIEQKLPIIGQAHNNRL